MSEELHFIDAYFSFANFVAQDFFLYLFYIYILNKIILDETQKAMDSDIFDSRTILCIFDVIILNKIFFLAVA